jgi:hypothetical protein
MKLELVSLDRSSKRHVSQVPHKTSSLNFTQFVESKYKIELNAAAASQLNRAIASGHEKGLFQLPKGERVGMVDSMLLGPKYVRFW